jgi:hypothetical protein
VSARTGFATRLEKLVETNIQTRGRDLPVQTDPLESLLSGLGFGVPERAIRIIYAEVAAKLNDL